MASDLISRKALLERWKYKFDHRKSLEECIMTQPTAYDVDKVVEQLEKRYQYCLSESRKYLLGGRDVWATRADEVKRSIEVIKAGEQNE